MKIQILLSNVWCNDKGKKSYKTEEKITSSTVALPVLKIMRDIGEIVEEVDEVPSDMYKKDTDVIYSHIIHKYKVPITVRFIDGDTKLNKIYAYFSRASIRELLSIVDRDIISDDCFILCPVYVTNGIYDFQIGISGFVKYKEYGRETPFESIVREIGEEVGLLVSDTYHPKNVYSKKYTFNIRNLLDIPMSYSNIVINNRKDVIPKEKVYCVIYGSEIDIDMYLTQRNIFRFFGNDGIIAIGKMKVLDIRKYFS